MDNLNKLFQRPVPGARRHRLPGRHLAAALMLIAPWWVRGEVPVTAAPAADNSVAATGAAPHAMHFVDLGRVTFVTNKWQLTDAAKQGLDRMAAYLLAHPGAERVLLEGHTDWVGGIKFNDQLSDKRALAVQDYLLGKGVAPALIHWKGHGKRAPIDENWTRLGRDRNRQVELYAVYLPTPDSAGP